MKTVLFFVLSLVVEASFAKDGITSCVSVDRNFTLEIIDPKPKNQIIATVTSSTDVVKMNCEKLFSSTAFAYSCNNGQDLGSKTLVLQVRPGNQAVYLGYYGVRKAQPNGGSDLIANFFDCEYTD